MASKRSANPLLGGSNFKIEESFGAQPALLVPSTITEDAPPAVLTASGLFKSFSTNDPFSSVNLTAGPPTPSSSPFSSNRSISGIGPPPTMSIAPPQPGLFLLPNAAQQGPSPTSLASSGSKPKSRYIPPPGIHASYSSDNLPAQDVLGPPPPMSMPPMSAMMSPTPPTMMPSSSSVPDFHSAATANEYANYGQGPELYPGQHGPTVSEGPKFSIPDEPLYHWYYRVLERSYNVLGQPATMDSPRDSWRPFSMRDSMSLEYFYEMDKTTTVLIPTDGGRYDVDIPKRIKIPVYWKDGLNDEMEVRRSSWFFKNGVNTWVPYDESLSTHLEEEYQSCVQSGQWKREIRLKDTNEAIRMITPNMMFHLPSEQSSITGKLDEWGQVQPPSQDPSLVPREVHRGIEGIIDDIPDGEDMACDHLVFVIHGIGAACDTKFRPIHEVVDSYRDLTHAMSKKHFQNAHLTEQVSRVEFLPVNWHTTLHGEDAGTDERLKPLTLKSIPKLRNFVNDTLLDILFYTSPIYCQTILDTVVSEINRLYTLFCTRNEEFTGKVSIMGHSLGSLITFDILSHQNSNDEDNTEKHVVIEKPPTETELNLEQVFAKLDITEHAEIFVNEGIDMESLMMCSEDDLKEAGLPLGPRKNLLKYIEVRKAIIENKLSGLEEYQTSSITSDVKYRIGPAGTGQPCVVYPKLDFEPASFYALGSPIALFHAVRGISNLGDKFKFPTCPKFFNIFHPYDPVAYRIESLIDKSLANLRPVTIPHHAGRKRMHLELKETVTKLMTGDLKKKVMDSVWSSLSAIYNTATGSNDQAEQRVNEAVEQKLEEDDALDSSNPSVINSMLNGGHRIDHVLQEAPYESFNEYVFALGSHLCYWESEDTVLMILKDIYSLLGVITDDQFNAPLHDAAPAVSSSASMYVVDSSIPTAILAPPPTPMGGPMSGPSVPVGPPPSSTPQPPMTSASSTLVPPGSFAPPTMTSVPSPSTLVPPGSMPGSFAPPTMTSPIGPPPAMMAPSAIIGPPGPPMGNVGNANLSRPRRAAYPIHVDQIGFGMDPTAPTTDCDRPLGPPPMSGFKR